MNKKRLICFIILSFLAISLTLISLFVPIVHIVGHAPDEFKTIVFNDNVSFVQYLKVNPFLTTAADTVYFSAEGPIWLSSGSILFSILLAILGIVMFILCTLEIVLCKKENISIKNNLLAKKISLVTGWFALLFGICAWVSYFVTTMFANGYVEFYSLYGTYLWISLGLAIMIISNLTGKRRKEQKISKLKNSLGFGFTGLFTAICALIPFISVYKPYFLGEKYLSMLQVSGEANTIMNDSYLCRIYGDYPFGFAHWSIYVIWFICIFIFLYSFIGLILSLANKKTNWLSSRVKRWTMTLIIVYLILYTLTLLQSAVLYSSVAIIDPIDSVHWFTPQFYALAFVPFLPYLFSTFISVNKKKKVKLIDK